MKSSAVINNYGKFSGIYDIVMHAVFLGKDETYRKKYINALKLKPGNTVLDLAGGTGMNFLYLEKDVGENGEIFAVDASPDQLKIYRKKVHGHNNAHTIQGNASNLPFPKKYKFDAILCTYAMCVIPDYKKAINEAVNHLKLGGKLVIADLKLMNGPMKIFNLIYWFFVSSFVGSIENLKRPITKIMEENGLKVGYEEFGVGNFLYLAVGTKS